MSSTSEDTPAVFAKTTITAADGKTYPLQSPCEIGRSSKCYISLDDTQISWTHSLIQRDSSGSWWITDLDSTNGTYVNQRRVTQATVLSDGDLLSIGNAKFTFKDTSGKKVHPEEQDLKKPTGTYVIFSQTSCWLLIADIINSVQLSRDISPKVLNSRVGDWGKAADEIISRHNGEINKFLGDGFFAFWKKESADGMQIIQAVTELEALHSEHKIDFRLIIHLGAVQLGGLLNKGEENLSGAAVNFIFKAEKVAGSIGKHVFISDAAAKEMPEAPLKKLGPHRVPGFPGETEFYALEIESA